MKEISQSTQRIASSLLLFDNGGLFWPNFSLSHDLVSNSNENERFPTLSEEELDNLRSKTKTERPPRVQNLAERKCSVAKRESWKISFAMS